MFFRGVEIPPLLAPSRPDSVPDGLAASRQRELDWNHTDPTTGQLRFSHTLSDWTVILVLCFNLFPILEACEYFLPGVRFENGNRERRGTTFVRRIFPPLLGLFLLFLRLDYLLLGDDKLLPVKRRMLGTLQPPNLFFWENLWYSIFSPDDWFCSLVFSTFFFWFIILSVWSHKIRMRCGCLLFFFTQIISVSPFIQTGRLTLRTQSYYWPAFCVVLSALLEATWL